ncbi:hypothetical protein [Companilactobacillus tucceti]|nr:hypothetical protein [Companilactobacillus tucceti]
MELLVSLVVSIVIVSVIAMVAFFFNLSLPIIALIISTISLLTAMWAN